MSGVGIPRNSDVLLFSHWFQALDRGCVEVAVVDKPAGDERARRVGTLALDTSSKIFMSSQSNMSKPIAAGITVALVLITQAMAQESQPYTMQEWQPYEMKRYGFIFDAPSDFAITDEFVDEGSDGTVFKSPDGALLTVWGIKLDGRDFLTQVEQQIREDEGIGWEVTYKRLTKEWVSYSGIKDGRIRYVRAEEVCDDRAAYFLLDYDQENKAPYNPIVTHLVRSLKTKGC